MKKVVFKTNRGDFELELWPEHAPKTVENFVKLVQDGFYNDTKFHRIIQGFMIQGGDPLSKNDEEQAYWGTGGPGYQFDCEIHDENKNAVGTISMANAGPNTNGSQFFINTSDNHFLNPKHTVFGKVLNGMDIVTDIESVSTNHMDRPMNDVVVELIEVLE